MKERIQLFLASLVLFGSMAFAFQKQDDPQKPKPQEDKALTAVEQLAKDVEEAKREIEKSKKEFADEMRKRDSLDAERRVNINIATKSVNDLQEANRQYKKSLNRLVYVIGKFNPDSVMKFYGEYKEPVPMDTTKKKIEYPEIEVPVQKKGFFKRLFSSKH